MRIFETGRPNPNHEFVARLAKEGLSRLVLTTNFDSLIEAALMAQAVPFILRYRDRDYGTVLRDARRFGVLKLHGSFRDGPGKPIIVINRCGCESGREVDSPQQGASDRERSQGS